MTRWFIIIISINLFAVTFDLSAQQADSSTISQVSSKSTYYERSDDGMIHFYYDDGYYLVDKDCEYFAFERIGNYRSKVGFIGPFADYDQDGRLILEGQYVNGQKDSLFTAYFANGVIQWQASFENNEPRGLWRFNYPDGKPLMELLYGENDVKLKNFWDERGRQRVTNGNGKYDFATKVRGFNEYGYQYIEYKGSVQNGIPKGMWTINYVFADGSRSEAAYEYYDSKQNLRYGYDLWEDERYGTSRIQVGPQVYIGRADAMMAKDCSVDEHEDFPLFIALRLEKALSRFDFSQYGIQDITVDLDVKKQGEADNVEVVQGYENIDEVRGLLERILIGIPYWIPSFDTDQEVFIDDQLKIHLQITPRIPPEMGIVINGIKIEREKGN